MTQTKPSSRGRWLKRLAVALFLYAFIGFLILPAVIKWQLRQQLPRFTQRNASVASVRVNPFALSLGLRDFALTEPDGTTFVSFSNLYVNFQPVASILNRAWTFDEVQLGSPYGYVALLTNGQLNFANMFTNAPATNPPPAAGNKPVPAALVRSIAITNGTLALADDYRARPFRTRFEPIDVRLTNFTTRPRTGSPYSFTASTGEGEYFRWSGDVHAFPPASNGRFELGGIDLKKYGTYVGEFTRLEVRDGKVRIGASYAFALETNGLELTVTNAGLAVTNLQVFAPGASNALVAVPSFVIRGASADLQQRTVRVQAVETAGGSLVARRFRDGSLELIQLAAPPTNRGPSILNPPPAAGKPAPPAPAATGAAKPWSVVVDTVAVADYATEIHDEQPPRPVKLVVDQMGLTVKGLSLASNAPISVQFATRVNKTGGVKIGAEGSVLPVALTVDVDVNSIGLPVVQPYLEQQQLKLALTSGSVSTKGRAAVALAGTNPPAISFAGDVVVNDLAVSDQVAFQDLIRWKQVAVRGIDFVLSPMSVKVRELACDSLAASVVVGTNKQLAVLAALPARTNAPAAPVAATPPAAPGDSLLPFPVQLDLLALTNASIHFADLSIDPHCRVAVQQFGGTVRGLSSAMNSVAEVDISGRVNESAPFSIAGRVNPLVRDLLVDMVISNRNTELTGFTPYMEKFAGHPLVKGKLSVGLKYSVQKQALEAQNVIFIDQLTLGAKNASPDATTLPVKLGVALLKDRNGRIELDVPVKGRLDDPKFRVLPVIMQVVRNLLLKAATSPFSMLGALVGGGEELSFIEFAPGQSVIGAEELLKVDKLGKALGERPALNLEILGSADEPIDRAALAWAKYEGELQALRRVGRGGQPDAAEEAGPLKLADYERLIRTAYTKAFQRDLPLPVTITNAAGVVVTNSLPSVPRAGAFKGAEAQIARAAAKPPAKETNAVAAIADPRAMTRPATLPALRADEPVLAVMEMELLQRVTVSAAELNELKQARAQSVQRALLKTEKVTADRLFILAPLPGGAAVKGQSRVNLSLN